MLDVDDYRTELVLQLSDKWKAAAESVKRAQSRQKRTYDRRATESRFKVGERVLVHMPHEVRANAWKFACPFHGPYRIVNLTPTNAEVKLVDKPAKASIFVALSRLRVVMTNCLTFPGPERKLGSQGRRQTQQTRHQVVRPSKVVP